MNSKNLAYLTIFLLAVSCTSQTEGEQGSQYYDIDAASPAEPLIAVADEEYPELGSDVAYVNMQGDTVIPFGDFAYFGTDTLVYYANVLLLSDEAGAGRQVGIDRHGNILFDLVNFDNGPDYFSEGLTRVLRDGKMGYANEKGEVVIPCQYAYAKWFENGVAEVTFEAEERLDGGEHRVVESSSWFKIDKQGNRIAD